MASAEALGPEIDNRDDMLDNGRWFLEQVI